MAYNWLINGSIGSKNKYSGFFASTLPKLLYPTPFSKLCQRACKKTKGILNFFSLPGLKNNSTSGLKKENKKPRQLTGN
jgi:hypothetical protein